jgi:hypothetical protein
LGRDKLNEIDVKILIVFSTNFIAWFLSENLIIFWHRFLTFINGLFLSDKLGRDKIKSIYSRRGEKLSNLWGSKSAKKWKIAI